MPKKQVAVSLRKPQPANIDAFVSAESPSAPPPKSTAKPRISKPDPVVQHNGRDYREIVVYMPAELARDLTFFCMDKQRELNSVINEAVSGYLVPTTAESAFCNPAPLPRASFVELSRQSLRVLWSLRPWA